MQLNSSEIEYIKKAFQKMKSKSDLLDLMNYCKTKIYGKNSKLFRVAQLNYHAFVKPTDGYGVFEIKKKSGTVRRIVAPREGLSAIQQTINLILKCIFLPMGSVHGFVNGRSVVSNARMHIGNNYVYNIDLADFFESIDQARVWRCLQNPPFHLSRQNRKLELANLLASLCCVELEVSRQDEAGKWVKVRKSVLPQGASTSPLLSNVVCQRLDYLFNGVAKRFGVKYSRYADDITFSSMHNVYRENGEFITEIRRIISEQKFCINENKVRLQKRGYRQAVTGLVVNEKVNISRRYINQLKMWLYLWETYGMRRAERSILLDYKKDKGHVKKNSSDISSIIAGRLEYVRMVKGNDDSVYQKLIKRFKSLGDQVKNNPLVSIQSMELNQTQPITLEEIPDQYREDRRGSFRLFKHTPFYTVNFLRLFKFGDGEGFKELVHDVDLRVGGLDSILTKVKRHPNFIYHFHNERLADIQFLNQQIQSEVILLIKKFEKEAQKLDGRKNKHPFNSIDSYRQFVQEFKTKYRYGVGREYSSLYNDIITVARTVGVDLRRLVFMPLDERKFGLRANFFTWKPSVCQGLKYVFEGIRDHSNLNGEELKGEINKSIRVECERKSDDQSSFVELSFVDVRSQCNVEPLKLLEFVKGSRAYKLDFRNICDWVIEADFVDGRSVRLNVLVSEHKTIVDELENLNVPVGGFKHTLKFYELS